MKAYNSYSQCPKCKRAINCKENGCQCNNFSNSPVVEPSVETKIKEIVYEVMDYSYDYGKGKIPMSENPPLLLARTAVKELESLLATQQASETKKGESWRKGYQQGVKESQAPMGVSEWINHGKKYGYYEYSQGVAQANDNYEFTPDHLVIKMIEKAIKADREKLLERINKMPLGLAESSKEEISAVAYFKMAVEFLLVESLLLDNKEEK